MELKDTVKECLQAVTREIECDASYVSFRVGRTLQYHVNDYAVRGSRMAIHRIKDTLCAETLASDAIVAVDDATKDERFSQLGFVTSGKVIGYIASPIFLDGEAVGTICAVTGSPRHWRSIEIELIRSLARTLEMSLQAELRQVAVERFATSLDEMDNILAILADGISGPVAIFDAEGAPVFFSETIPSLVGPRCMKTLGHDVVSAYETSVAQQRLASGEKLEMRISQFDLAVVKASEKYYYCSVPQRMALLH